MEVLSKAMLLIIFQHIKVSNQHIVHNAICQLDLNKAGKKSLPHYISNPHFVSDVTSYILPHCVSIKIDL